MDQKEVYEMIVQLSRTSTYGEKPDEIAYPIGVDVGRYGDFLADIPSIEWAVDKWGELVIKPSYLEGVKLHVEIYDDYRE